MDNKRKFNDYYYGMAKKSKKDEDSGSDDEKSLLTRIARPLPKSYIPNLNFFSGTSVFYFEKNSGPYTLKNNLISI